FIASCYQNAFTKSDKHHRGNGCTQRLQPKAFGLFEQVAIHFITATTIKLVFRGPVPAQEALRPLEVLVDDIVLTLSKDSFQKGYFTKLDVSALIKGNWPGRRWILHISASQRMALILDLLEGKLQLCLFLPFSNNHD
ncbi:MAG TPA: hypothetical protein VD794_09190, partial [Flavisolibacter sp.]|nr:hypothetical protein [Flavisolibacter sp.]